MSLANYSEEKNKKLFDSIEINDYVKVNKNYYLSRNDDVFKVKFKVIDKSTTYSSTTSEILYLIKLETLFGDKKELNVWYLDLYNFREEKLKRILNEEI